MVTRRAFLAQGTAALAGAVVAPGWLRAQETSAPSGARAPAAGVAPIPTATGEILPGDMGITSLHEHIALRGGSRHDAEGKAFAIRELLRAKKLGLRTIVDVGPPDQVAGIQEVAQATGINVICCTGFYMLDGPLVARKTEDFEADMLRDIEHGLQGTSVRPGVIKVAARGLPIRPAERNLFIAAARVQQRTTCPSAPTR